MIAYVGPFNGFGTWLPNNGVVSDWTEMSCVRLDWNMKSCAMKVMYSNYNMQSDRVNQIYNQPEKLSITVCFKWTGSDKCLVYIYI